MEDIMRKPELLVPASSLEVLKVAVVFGADAVYIGGEAFGLRAKAKNFSMEEIKEGIAFAHAHGVRVYVTANILAHNRDLDGVRAYFEELKEIGPDALIISDPGVYQIAKEVCPEIERHISTQANNTNYGTYLFWHSLGAKRVVSARELSLEELKEIRSKIPEEMEIDVDADGADVLVWNSGGYALALFWSSSYLSADGRRKAIAFHEKHSPALTLAFSLFPEREQMLVYRIEKGFIEYLHIEKDTFEEKVLRRCTIDEGKKDGGQLLLPIRRKRGRKIT